MKRIRGRTRAKPFIAVLMMLFILTGCVDSAYDEAMRKLAEQSDEEKTGKTIDEVISEAEGAAKEERGSDGDNGLNLGIDGLASRLGSAIGSELGTLSSELGSALGHDVSSITGNVVGAASKDVKNAAETAVSAAGETAVNVASGAGELAVAAGKDAVGAVRDTKDAVKDTVKDIINYNDETETGNTEDVSETGILEGPYEILAWSDGDTLKLKEYGKDVRFRLIGIDTPESVATEEYLESSGKKNTEEGKDASAYVKEHYPKGTKVYIEWDAGQEDKYGRKLIYLYADVGGSRVFVNEQLLKMGLARLFTLQPNVRYADTVFYKAQTYAREKGNGFWGTGFFEE